MFIGFSDSVSLLDAMIIHTVKPIDMIAIDIEIPILFICSIKNCVITNIWIIFKTLPLQIADHRFYVNLEVQIDAVSANQLRIAVISDSNNVWLLSSK